MSFLSYYYCTAPLVFVSLVKRKKNVTRGYYQGNQTISKQETQRGSTHYFTVVEYAHLHTTLAAVRLEPMTLIISPHVNFNFYDFKKWIKYAESGFEPVILDLNAKMLTTTPAELLLERGTSFRWDFCSSFSKKCLFKKIHFSKTSGNLGFWPTLNQRLDHKVQLVFNAIGRQVAAYTFLEFFKIGFLWYEIGT